MPDAWKPIFLCAASEVKDFSRLDALGLLVAVVPDGASLSFLRTGRGKVDPSGGIAFADVYPDAVAFMSGSPAANTLFRQVEALWETRASSRAPVLCQDAGWRGRDMMTAVAQIMVRRMAELHDRNVALMRNLSAVRDMFDRAQASFERVERHLNAAGNDLRSLVRWLPVDASEAPLALRAAPQVEQRLPLDSSGLSDVAISLHAAPSDPVGTLHATLELRDGGEIVAEWTVSSERLRAGWLRLALPRALDHDPQSAILRLWWQGEGSLLIDSSHRHPDARFAPLPEAPMLALQCWKAIPGALAPLSADAIAAKGALLARRWTIGRSLMSAATGDPACVEYSNFYGGLFVRPRPGLPGVARLDAALRPGAFEVTGGIKIEQDSGAEVQFALAARPSHLRRPSAEDPTALSDTLVSAWLTLPPGVWSMHNLHLAQPLNVPHDLYLLTRLAEGVEPPPESPQACFFQMTATGDPDAWMPGHAR